MGYTEYPPRSELQGFVKCFWSIADEASDEVQEVWPDGCVELMFTPGNTFRVNTDGSSERFPRVFVLGVQAGIIRVRAEGKVRMIGVRMFPFGLRDMNPSELDGLQNRIEPLLRSCQFTEAIRLAEAWLLELPKIHDSLAAALRHIYASGGAVSITDLAAEQGVSSRHLQRSFAAKVGIPPKTLAKIVRFALSWSTMLSRPDMTLVELALALGYSDQAHFSNEFRSISRQTPRGFRKQWKKS